MTIIFYLTVLLFSLGQLGRISFFNQQINFYFYEISLFCGLVYLVFKYKLQPLIDAWERHRPMYLFILTLSLSLIWNFSKFNLFQNFVGSLYFLRLLMYFLYFFYLKFHLKKNPEFAKVVKRGMISLAVLTIVSTLIQYFFYPDLRNLIYQGWDPHLYRTFGVFFDTSISAAIFGLFFLASEQPIVKMIYLLLTALSFSRNIYIGLSLTLFYVFIRQKKLRRIFLFLIVFAALIFFIPKPSGEGVDLRRLYSVASRGEDYLIGLNLWKNQPLLGYGYNRIRYIKKSDSLHSGAAFSSSFLTILVSSGVFGLISFLWMLWQFRKSNKLAPVILIFLSIISLFDNVFLHPFILFLFFTLIV